MATCLIADDSKIIRMVLAKIMSNLSFNVLEAEDGEEVVELCQQNEPELIIMDWNLPLIEGIDVLYKIRSQRGIKQPKIIVCSSTIDIDKIKEAIQGGADDFIIRPFDEDIIFSKLAIMDLV